eukprot:763860-Hanusia_phi.AAC.6
MEGAGEEVKTLGGTCKDSDHVIEKINSVHEKLSRQGEERRRETEATDRGKRKEGSEDGARGERRQRTRTKRGGAGV